MKVVVPHMGNTYIILRALFEELNIDYVIPPLNSSHSLNLGVRYSPEAVCLPYKLTMGNFIEGLEAGADTLLFTEARGTCRLGYYFRLQTQTIKEDLKRVFKTVTLKEHSLKGLLDMKKALAPQVSWPKAAKAMWLAFSKMRALDELEKLSHQMRPREKVRGTTTGVYRKGVDAIDNAFSFSELKQTRRNYREELLGIATNGVEPLKIGVIGEFFVVLDPFSNYNVEIELGKLGCEVRRSLWLSKWIWTNFPFLDAIFHWHLHQAARSYLKRDIGGDGWESVGEKVSSKLDGLVHLHPFNCMPETVAINIMKRVPGVPTLHISCDEQTSQAGVITRLEAFTDMLKRRKR